ncbi:MAG: hypothetical protein IPJ46_06830 [Anaerolineales bacterium]|nr:hypothetical protein [Anaerolineales bacterium]
MAKKYSANLETISLKELDRTALYRNIYDKLEVDPPVGERYPFLLKKYNFKRGQGIEGDPNQTG